jgi:hypothetical protein
VPGIARQALHGCTGRFRRHGVQGAKKKPDMHLRAMSGVLLMADPRWAATDLKVLAEED